MGLVIYYGNFIPHQRLMSSNIRAVDASNSLVLRISALERVDEELVKGNERAALSLLRDLQGKPEGLRCFGAARQVPQRLYTLDELKLNGIDTLSLLSPVDVTLGQIERNLQLAAVFGGLSAWVGFGLNQLQILFLSLGILFLWTVDQVSFGGGVGSLLLDTVGHAISQKYHNRVIQTKLGVMLTSTKEQVQQVHFLKHEAGHFLIAYLLGVLPRGYTLSSLEALRKDGSLNVQAGTAFVDFEFLEEESVVQSYGDGNYTMMSNKIQSNREISAPCEVHDPLRIMQILGSSVNAGKLSAKMLNRFSCIALAGVATEYLLFGCSEGGLGDISKLDGLLKSLGFTQKKADSQVRWAVLNTILILRRHEGARSKVAEAMSLGRSVGFCIDTIEKAINSGDV